MKKLTTSILLASSLIVFSGCEKSLDVASKPRIDMTLPIVLTDSIKSISDYQAIALEWQSVTVANIEGYHIYRANMQEDGKKFKRIATLTNKYQSHYLDKNLSPNSKYSYAISVIGKDKSESTPSKAIIVKTLPNLESVSLITSISELPRQVKILWRPHTSERISEYIIERTTPTNSKWEKITTIKDRYNVEYIDSNLDDNTIYMYRIKAVTFDEIVSVPSDMSKATTKPLPNQIKSLEGTKSLPRKIQLSWGESSTKDVVQYEIYRSESVDGSFSKIAQAPAAHNRFDDVIEEDGKIYFYKIITVDKDGLKSKIEEVSPIMGASLDMPKMPRITLAQIQGNKIILNWDASDNRAVSYNVFKSVKDGWASSDVKLIPNVVGERFEDPDVVRGVEYKYSIQAVDKHGLVSKETNKVSQLLPKIHPEVKE